MVCSSVGPVHCWLDHTRGKHANYYSIYVALLVLYTFGLTILEANYYTIYVALLVLYTFGLTILEVS
jgi:hypothetical protein